MWILSTLDMKFARFEGHWAIENVSALLANFRTAFLGEFIKLCKLTDWCPVIIEHAFVCVKTGPMSYF